MEFVNIFFFFLILLITDLSKSYKTQALEILSLLVVKVLLRPTKTKLALNSFKANV